MDTCADLVGTAYDVGDGGTPDPDGTGAIVLLHMTTDGVDDLIGNPISAGFDYANNNAITQQ